MNQYLTAAVQQYLTTAQAAVMLQLSEDRVRRLALLGVLPGVRVGVLGQWRFDPAELRRVLQGQAVPLPVPTNEAVLPPLL
jgi:excisionase family DNA binding protein